MLDIGFIIKNTDKVKKAITDKRIKLDLDELLSADTERRKVLQEVEMLQKQRNENTAIIQKAGGKPEAALIAEGKSLKEKIAEAEPHLKAAEEHYRELMLLVPNIPSDDTPIGADDSGNKEVRTWGKPRVFDFPMKDHTQLGEDLDLIDTERGVKVAGFRGYFLKNDLVLLQWALFTHCLNKMREKGFQILLTPTMVKEFALVGSGHFPGAREEIYAVDERFLAGTSEASSLAYRAEEMIDLKEFPLKYCAISPCYRREIGSHGKDTKGLYRVHEFWKIEQVVICQNDMDISIKLFEEMLGIAEEVLQDLELPYRVLSICTGDMGAGKYKMYDLETWMPSRNGYGETHSCSHLTDWQARRVNMRYKDAAGHTQYPHTMNNTVIASPRILIALLENYQNPDGSVTIPKLLQPLMGGKTSIGKR
jgi:seryl-tRNA synthetase